MDKDMEQIEKSGELPSTDVSSDSKLVGGVATRRNFNRQAIVGGVVLASLANRSAWAKQTDQVCASINTLASYNNGVIASMHPGMENNMKQINAFSDALTDGYVPTEYNPPGQTCLEPPPIDE